jgi:GTP cyclohydrolase I
MPDDKRGQGDCDDLEFRVRQIVEQIEQGDTGAGAPAESRPTGGIEEAVRRILTEIGEDPDREGLLRTPERMHRMWLELTCGYLVDPEKLINGAIFDVGYSEMVVVKYIPFYSLCEHHMLPFFGAAHVAYLPTGRIVGLSKIARVVDIFARRLQVQERLTDQIADALQCTLEPGGVGVVVEAYHLCMMMRGVEKQHSKTVTSALRGAFRDDPRTRDEFLRLVQGGFKIT